MQDILHRSVYWILFPVLAILFVAIRLSEQSMLSEMIWIVLINASFITLQLLLVSAWFSFKAGKFVNIISDLLGWGDILFLVALCFYLSLLNFLFFYIVSMITILLFWLTYQQLISKKESQIPLAGLQSVLFMLFFITDQWVNPIGLTSDDWLLRFLIK